VQWLLTEPCAGLAKGVSIDVIATCLVAYGVLSRRAVDLAFHLVDKTMQGLRRADSPRDCFVRRG
jgi:hypothetical protein